ncbi:hypothetical protein COU58_02450 [Candidatus Pacearchaeota archaeon CG10_big_fil_rev_8_21_14_0_10_32_42]|nr:MAG: hypothetical protein COU58_02450 [Candidatus Pacearchaeota archaeon CG10_big_fil_rev_8_21_14_0_10_32_42]
MQEYYFQNGEELKKFKTSFLPEEDYLDYRGNFVRVCHDAFILYGGKILLFKRNNEPEKGEFWPIGGGVLRGRDIENSLKEKVMDECGLEIKIKKLLGINRLLIGSSESLKRGSDDIVFTYLVEGYGKMVLNSDNKEPLFLYKNNCSLIKPKLNMYVAENVKKILEFIL